jgi:hypothetical protein
MAPAGRFGRRQRAAPTRCPDRPARMPHARKCRMRDVGPAVIGQACTSQRVVVITRTGVRHIGLINWSRSVGASATRWEATANAAASRAAASLERATTDRVRGAPSSVEAAALAGVAAAVLLTLLVYLLRRQPGVGSAPEDLGWYADSGNRFTVFSGSGTAFGLLTITAAVCAACSWQRRRRSGCASAPCPTGCHASVSCSARSSGSPGHSLDHSISSSSPGSLWSA